MSFVRLGSVICSFVCAIYAVLCLNYFLILPKTSTTYIVILLFVIPLLLALFSSVFNKPKFLVITSIWSLPMSFYFLTSELFLKYIVIGPIILLVTGLMLNNNKKKPELNKVYT